MGAGRLIPLVVLGCASQPALQGVELTTVGPVGAVGRPRAEAACRPDLYREPTLHKAPVVRSRIPTLGVLGENALDAGDIPDAAFVDDCLVDRDVGSALLLGKLGWSTATPGQREVLALAWVADVLQAFTTEPLREAWIFGAGGYPSYTPPVAHAKADGGVTVELWTVKRRFDGEFLAPTVDVQLERWWLDAGAAISGPMILDHFEIPRARRAGFYCEDTCPPLPSTCSPIAALGAAVCGDVVLSGCCQAPAATSAALVLLRAGWLRSDAARREGLVREYMTQIYVPLVLRQPGTPVTTRAGVDRIEANVQTSSGLHTLFFDDTSVSSNKIR